jgi:hypothetical protein
MSRSAFEIAATGCDDLFAIDDAFQNLLALFAVMLQSLPEGHAAHSLASLGALEAESWRSKVCQWAECMDRELSTVNVGGAQ